MDKDKKHKSSLGNDKYLQNAEKDKVTGIKTRAFRKDNDKPVDEMKEEAKRKKD